MKPQRRTSREGPNESRLHPGASRGVWDLSRVLCDTVPLLQLRNLAQEAAQLLCARTSTADRADPVALNDSGTVYNYPKLTENLCSESARILKDRVARMVAMVGSATQIVCRGRPTPCGGKPSIFAWNARSSDLGRPNPIRYGTGLSSPLSPE